MSKKRIEDKKSKRGIQILRMDAPIFSSLSVLEYGIPLFLFNIKE